VNKKIAIVDPFSSGRHLAPYLKKQFGVDSIAILSSRDLPQFYLDSFQAQDFSQVLKDLDEASLVTCLKELGVTSVIAGSEPGVLLADRLAETLGLICNVFELSAARRDKFLMGEAVKKAGLRSVKQILARSTADAIRWKNENNLSQVVLKPKDSAGTDGVSLCHSDQEIITYFNDKLGKRTMLQTAVDAILVQEYLEGKEYVVDTVSLDSRAEVAAVWRYAKCNANGSAFVYDTMTLLTSLSPQEEELVNYTLKCLEALGLKNGPAHTEVMLTASGPCLIESGARIHGGNGTLISGVCVGYNQIDRTALVFAQSETFLSSFKKMYSTEKAAIEIFLISSNAGSFSKLNNLELVKSLSTYHSMTFSIKSGDRMERTTDLFSSPGRIILIGHPDRLMKDYQSVRQWEEGGAYEMV
jgi:biotin carboxylase